MYEFNYIRASSVADAVAAMQGAADGRFFAGGMTLIPTLKQRLASPSDLIDLRALEALRFVRLEGDRVVIGAMTTHDRVATAGVVRASIPALASLASGIGDAQVRNCGTIGGSLANNDPAADYPAAVLALDATIITDRREIAAKDYFRGMFQTPLEPDELITEVVFPVPEMAAYAKFEQRASRYALVGVMVAKLAAGVRVAVTGAAPCVFRQIEMEAALSRRFAPEALDGITTDAEGLNSDIHASAEYRAHLIGVLARRAVASAL